MKCDAALPLLDAYVDGELDAADRHPVAGHVASCPICAARARQIGELRTGVKGLGRLSAPESLRQELRRAIAAAPAPSSPWRLPATFALGMAAGAALALLVVLWPGGIAPASPGVAEFVSAYVRAQMAARDISIASNDPHSVRPWLGGRIGIAPRVADLAEDGFPLLGARIDHVGGQDAVALVYGRRKHRVDLFVQADDTGAMPQGQRHGFTVLSWRDADLRFVAVSDIAPAELDEFVGLVRKRAGMGAFVPPKAP